MQAHAGTRMAGLQADAAGQTEVIRLQLDDDELRLPVRRQSRRTLALHVLRDGSFEVRAPQRLPLSLVRSFVESRRDWLSERRAHQEQAPAADQLAYHDGASHWFLGEQWRLKLLAATRWFASVGDGEIRLATAKLDADSVSKALQRFYQREAELRLPERLRFWHRQIYQREAGELRLRAMRSRWGSCASDGVITLNTSLLRAPWPAIDYVIVHELCHLTHFNHGKRFVAMMSRVLPDWQARRAMLKQPCGF